MKSTILAIYLRTLGDSQSVWPGCLAETIYQTPAIRLANELDRYALHRSVE